MVKLLFKICLIGFLAFSLGACTHMKWSPAQLSELQQGKRYFEDGYYKKAMKKLLPLACDGNPEAQYGVGYMYYYGYGVAQDTDVGYFWIQRSANQGYPPAVKAMSIISKQQDENFQLSHQLRKE